jgi:hypothetical protein
VKRIRSAIVFPIILAQIVLFAGSAVAQSDREVLRDLRSVRVEVKDEMDAAARKLGITHGMIKSEVEARLLQAGIDIKKGGERTSGRQEPHIVLVVAIKEIPMQEFFFFDIDLELSEDVKLARRAYHIIPTSTWKVGSMGWAKKQHLYRQISTILGDLTDLFIREYKMVNP